MAIGTAATLGIIGLTALVASKATSKLAKKKQAEEPATTVAGTPPEEEPAAVEAPAPPPSVPQMTSKATVDARGAAERQRKRAAAGGTALSKAQTPTSGGKGSYNAASLIGS